MNPRTSSKKGIRPKEESGIGASAVSNDLKPSSSWKDKNKSGKGPGITMSSGKYDSLSTLKWQEKFAELQQNFEEARDNNELLEVEIMKRDDRYTKREKELRKIIDELREDLRTRVSTNIKTDKNMPHISTLHNRIVDNLQNIQLKTSKVLLDQEKDIIRFFNAKINDIKRQFEEEKVKKGQKDQDFLIKESQLISELEWIKDVAQKIDQENHNLMQKYLELQDQFRIQQNDKDMIMKELILKKKKISILDTQVTEYEKVMKEASKEVQREESMAGDGLGSRQEERKSGVFENKPGNSANVSKSKDFQIRKTNQGFKQARSPSNQSGIGITSKVMNKSKMSGLGGDVQPIEEQKAMGNKIIDELKRMIDSENRKLQNIKMEYVIEMQMRNAAESLLRECIEDVREDLMRANTVNDNKHKTNASNHNQALEQILNDERTLTMIYDKAFYSTVKTLVPNAERDQQKSKMEDK